MPIYAFTTIKMEPLIFVKAADIKTAFDYAIQKFPASISSALYQGEGNYPELRKRFTKYIMLAKKLSRFQVEEAFKEEGLDQVPYVDLTKV